MTDRKANASFLRIVLAVPILIVPLVSACGDGEGNPDPDPDPPRADSIAISPSSVSFDAIDDTLRVTATVLDQYGDPMVGAAILWASDNPSIATVNEGGLITSVADGETLVRAQAGAERGSVEVEVAQEPHVLEIVEGNHQFHWTGFLLRDELKVRLTDGAGTPVVGEEVSWEVVDGDGTVLPETNQTDVDGEAAVRWGLGEGASGSQTLSATVSDLDPVTFEATGSAPISRLSSSSLSGPMLDTLTTTLLTLDSLGAPDSGIPVNFVDLTGFGEIVQGPTTTDVNGELVIKWALGPTPGPQEVTVVRSDINANVELKAVATGELDPWPFTTVEPGFFHTCAIDSDASGFCWGINEDSQLGTEDTLAVEAPAPIPGDLAWAEIGAGEFHTCGLTTAGEVYCWGSGYPTGQDGEGDQLVPVPTMVDAGPWASVTVGAYHNCVMDGAGAGSCWGSDDELEGRLGNGIPEPTVTPTPIEGGHSWAQLSAGHFHTCGVDVLGDAYCWGRGEQGQLGSGGVLDQGVPVLVAGGRDWVQVSAGRYHSCGISTAGDAFCWGEGGTNQLGNGSSADQTSPVKVAGGHLWTDVNAGQVHTCGVDVNKKLYCWGREGFIGVGGFGAPTPVVILPAYDWESVHTQGIHTCAITSAGETYCWGPNDWGQLGIGNTEDFRVPRMVFRGVILP